MDKRINEKLLKQPSSKEIHRKDIVVATPPQKHFNQLRYSLIIKLCKSYTYTSIIKY